MPKISFIQAKYRPLKSSLLPAGPNLENFIFRLFIVVHYSPDSLKNVCFVDFSCPFPQIKCIFWLQFFLKRPRLKKRALFQTFRGSKNISLVFRALLGAICFGTNSILTNRGGFYQPNEQQRLGKKAVENGLFEGCAWPSLFPTSVYLF